MAEFSGLQHAAPEQEEERRQHQRAAAKVASILAVSAAEGASSKTDRNTLTLLGARGARPVPWAGQRVPSAGEVGGVVPAGVTPQSPVQRCTAPLPIRGKSRARTRELHGLPSASRSPKEKSSGGIYPPELCQRLSALNTNT